LTVPFPFCKPSPLKRKNVTLWQQIPPDRRLRDLSLGAGRHWFYISDS